MNLSSTSIVAVKQAIQTAVKELQKRSEQPIVTDIYLQPNADSGSLAVMDDDDHILASTQVKEWIHLNNDDFYSDIAKELRNLLQKEKDSGLFESIDILKPYSFVLLDEEGEVLEDLLLVDDDLLIVNDELLKGLDDELDEFLNHLLED